MHRYPLSLLFHTHTQVLFTIWLPPHHACSLFLFTQSLLALQHPLLMNIVRLPSASHITTASPIHIHYTETLLTTSMMCTELHTHYPNCPHTHFLRWDYCSLTTSRVSTAGKNCRKYRRRVTSRRRRGAWEARECQNCAMDRKIREDFGDEAVPEPVRKRRRFWSRGHDAGDEGNEVPTFALVEVAADLEAWPAGEMMPLVLPDGENDKTRGRRRGRSRTGPLDSDSSWGASMFSFGSFGSRTTQDPAMGGMLSWAKCLLGRSSQ